MENVLFKPGDFCLYAEDAHGGLLAEITYPPISSGTVNLNHTYVSPSLRGRGIADTLVRMACEDIEARKMKAVASCSYAKKWLAQHPDIAARLCP